MLRGVGGDSGESEGRQKRELTDYSSNSETRKKKEFFAKLNLVCFLHQLSISRAETHDNL